ncbi:MAG: thiamine pyrophosphate-binding protein [Clostridiales Family XIII bacterium]|jgi:acetolactate synthase-1/2/3 large subunit|nr:thiamine pyrophosphate-binding protein [Clostridiales Family XIII bacterium]
MNASEYIVSFLKRKGILDVFGYQGTMIIYLADALASDGEIHSHSCYNEQGAAFAAVGAAKATGTCAVCYATSGPGAVNLLSGVADAYFDAAPVLFITGQLNTNEYTGIDALRQQGFQQIDIVQMAKPITKYCRQITDAQDVPSAFEEAFEIASSGRMGPVLIDLPMDIQRTALGAASAPPAPANTGRAGEQASDIVGGQTSGIASGQTSNIAGGQTSGIAGGQTSGIAGGQTSGIAGGQTSNIADGQTSGSIQTIGNGIQHSTDFRKIAEDVLRRIGHAKRPVLALGNGVPASKILDKSVLRMVDHLGIPVITSLLGRDILPYAHPLNFGFFGAAYGHRYANMIVGMKADCIIAIGCSLCRRQTGQDTEGFARGAEIIRIDVDEVELLRSVHADEIRIVADAAGVIDALSASPEASVVDASSTSPAASVVDASSTSPATSVVDASSASPAASVVDTSSEPRVTTEIGASPAAATKQDWIDVCSKIKRATEAFDEEDPCRAPNAFIRLISNHVPDGTAVCCDVGQHMMWTAQSYRVKDGQRLLFSGGHGAMGFSLPAAIGASYATQRPTVCICGDGSLQMNIQELQWVAREALPVAIFICNNNSLGLIRQQQDGMFNGNYAGAAPSGGYTAPDFVSIGKAYGIDSVRVEDADALEALLARHDFTRPALIDIRMPGDTRACPKTRFGDAVYNQEPYIPDTLFRMLSDL